MRIGLFTHVYPPMVNGVAVSTKELERELKKQGHDVFVITNNYDKLQNNFTEETNLKVASIPLFYQNLRTPILYNPSLFEKMDELNLDVIHSHSDFGIGLLSRIYSFHRKVPHIQTYHCNYVEYANSNFGSILGKVSIPAVSLYTKYLGATTNRLIAPSYENYRLLTEGFKLKRQIDMIPNGIDLEKFRDIDYKKVLELKEKYKIDNNDFVLLSISRLSKEKQIDKIIDIMPHLKECEKIKLLIVGGGPEEEKLKKKSADLQLENVIFTGEVNNNDISYYYKLGTAFITNSIAETQGLTVIEALASSIPVLCINSPLYQNIITNDKNGILYDNSTNLIKIVKQLYKNRDYIQKMKQHTELSVLKFSIQETSKEIVNVYESEVEKGKYR